MANKKTRRLAQIHHDAARALQRLNDAPKYSRESPRSFKQRATLWLNRLVELTKVRAEGLTREQIYLEAVRVLVEGYGSDFRPFPLIKLHEALDDWARFRDSRAQASDAQNVAPSINDLDNLRAELRSLSPLPENEAIRFKIETEIYRLERAQDDEWPDIIAA